MSIAPQLCQDCLRENRIATVNGPTCIHQPDTGAVWFPVWWGGGVDDRQRRIDWLVTKQK